MIEFLRSHLEQMRGAAPIRLMMVGDRSFFEYVLYAVDEAGIVVARLHSPDDRLAVPWTSVRQLMPGTN